MDWNDPDFRESQIAKKWAEAEDKIDRLRAEVEALRADAERYRCLRINGVALDYDDNGVAHWPHDFLTDRSLDVAVDALRGEGE